MKKLILRGFILLVALTLGACSHMGSHKPSKSKKSYQSQIEEAVEGDGPPDDEIDVTHIPNAKPKIEPLSRYGNPHKYEVFGTHYHTLPHSNGYHAEGTASWYGRKFHGQRTSSGEKYDMYGMTAAHRSLPLPTYAKVENLHNGKEVIVKINDRGPFVKDRLIDLSYAAAKKLGIHARGTGKVRITAIDPVAWHKQEKATALAHKGKAAKSKSNNKETKLAKAGQPKVTTAKAASTKTTTAKAASTKTTTAKATTTKVAKATTAASTKKIYIQLGAFDKKDNAQLLAQKATTLASALSNVNINVVDKKSDKGAYKVRVGPLKDSTQAKTLQKKFLALNGASPKIVHE